ncbi:DegT/DnrJ/EryC1/StrS family aminotransferase [Algibacter sp. TI.3.09]|uniref:DegT/DnrJ/EryC1/StrS family aminotransferase n=1 Tax=Algibacter sp. TI.3.09 TaxID=3121298 RepID=UPI00311F3955
MIKFLDLKLINKNFEKEFKARFDAFLNSGQYILGEEVLKFEEQFAAYCGVKHCIGVSSGLDALQLIFEAYKVLGKLKEGDEVIVPANTYIATILAISNTRLVPVLVEPDIHTYNIDVSKIESAITEKTKAVLGVHLYGQLCNVERLEEVCKINNLLLIEDAAQAHGARYADGRRAGNVSDASAFSFYPTKNLGALGDAGAVTTNNLELAEAIFKLRNYGRTSTYKNDIKGFNCRLDELQATFLSVKLKHLDSDNLKRNELANLYLNNINNSKITLPYFSGEKDHVFHQFVIRCEERDHLKDHLFQNGIESFIHYPIPTHKQMAYKELGGDKYAVTEKIHDEVLSLPINLALTQDDIFNIIDTINKF